MTLTPLARRRLAAFRANRRGYWSLWIFLGLVVFCLLAEFWANDRPLFVWYDGKPYVPIFADYAETTFGGDFATPADYRDPFVTDSIAKKGWVVWPPVRFDYKTINLDSSTPAPAPPSATNWLGTDDQGHDVLARLIYGLRVSILFGLLLTVISSVIGIAAGAIQGYFGGLTDLIFQRVLEIWNGLPELYVLMFVASLLVPSFWTLLGILTLFSWVGLVAVVRAEFLRARNFDYVRAARALGMQNRRIILRHVLPNAMVATVTYLPFITNGSIASLTALDFLGLGLPPGSASLGDLLRQGKENLQAPWLGITGFVVLAVTLSLLIFVGEAARDAFDPRKTRL
ncbi:MAG TPA: ABC transporter permease [Magnetospirillaceae bacterium]|jgi:microcin C transport system permease protein